MQFGLTHHQKKEREEAWKPRFAWVPVRLHDGSWLWLEPYFVRFSKSDPTGFGCSEGAYFQRFKVIPKKRERHAPPPKQVR